MSLDVYLVIKGVQNLPTDESVILINENGQIRQITRDEWDERFPDRDPVTVWLRTDDDEVYNSGITSFLDTMAAAAGLYEYLWTPDEIGIITAQQLIEPLQKGLKVLLDNPIKFSRYNPDNGRGTYESLVKFVRDYLEACKEYPNAQVNACR